jgi:hypothetical protein
MENSFKDKLIDLNSPKFTRSSFSHLKSRFSKNSLKKSRKNIKREHGKRFLGSQLGFVIVLRECMILQ